MSNVRLKLFTSKKLKDGSHPVMLVVTRERVRKYYSTGYSSTEKDWMVDDDGGGKFRKSMAHASQKNKAMMKKVWKAEEIIVEFEAEGIDWSQTDFKDKFIGIKSRDVFEYFKERIDDLTKEGKIGNADSYECAGGALKKFVTKKDLRFSEITYRFLKKYETHLRSTGIRDTTISSYMRSLRAVINRAIKDDVCKPEYYPFKKYKISDLDHTTEKRAISKDDIDKIFGVETDENTTELHSKHLFMFSFYAMGMSFKDMTTLKWFDVIGGRIHYKRAKTGKHFSIKILPPMQTILDHRLEDNKNDNPYVFEILSASYTDPKAIDVRIKSGLRTYNKHLKHFAKILKLDVKVTSYVSRHSWANILRNKGVSIEDISQGLGHSDLQTTKIYLRDLEDSHLDSVNELLL